MARVRLVPLDGSARAEASLGPALALAGGPADVLLLQVIGRAARTGYGPPTEEPRRKARSRRRVLPIVSGRELELKLLARVQPYLWFVGMALFSFTGHIAGLLGLPRRVFATGYAGADQAQAWETLTRISALGGVLFASAGFFVLVMLGTLLAGQRNEQVGIVWADSLGRPEGGYADGIWDRLGLWFGVAVLLVVLAYAIPLWDLLQLTRYGSPGFKPF